MCDIGPQVASMVPWICLPLKNYSNKCTFTWKKEKKNLSKAENKVALMPQNHLGMRLVEAADMLTANPQTAQVIREVQFMSLFFRLCQ